MNNKLLMIVTVSFGTALLILKKRQKHYTTVNNRKN